MYHIKIIKQYIMERKEFIAIMVEQVEQMKKERKALNKELKKSYDFSTDLLVSKLGHEISAVENAIRELQR